MNCRRPFFPEAIASETVQPCCHIPPAKSFSGGSPLQSTTSWFPWVRKEGVNPAIPTIRQQHNHVINLDEEIGALDRDRILLHPLALSKRVRSIRSDARDPLRSGSERNNKRVDLNPFLLEACRYLAEPAFLQSIADTE